MADETIKTRSWNLSVTRGVGVLVLDEPDTEVNVLTTANLTELGDILQRVSKRTDLGALVIASAKKRIFIAGADIKEIEGISTEKDAYDKAEQGKAVLQLLEDLTIPTVTVINGACLGGGYELALCTDLRVASFSDSIKIGLPEANLGILPGFGGSIRLPRLVGLLAGLPLILAGKMLSPQDALRKGIVDRLFPEKTLREDAIELAIQASGKGAKALRKPRKQTLQTKLLEGTIPGRALVFKQARKDVLKRTKGFYPAPLKIIDLIEKTYGKAPFQSYKQESKYFSQLGATEVSKNLIHLFFLSEKYKKFKWTAHPMKGWPVRKCGVIGAGVMGGGIAQRVTSRNIPVRIKDINEQALAGALKEARSIYDGAVKRRRIKKHERDLRMSMISVGLTNQGLKGCDIIVEAVVENLDIKKKVFQELGETAREDAILASNTSSLPVTEMARACRNPERVVGLHFFNPVSRMPLVEVIRGEQTSEETLEKTIQFARALGKTVIVVNDAPGFLVNRLLMPYLNEAAYLMEEGMAPDELDRIAVKFGMPMGPVELVDQVGVDVGYKVAHILEEAFGERMKVASILHGVYEKKFLGKKTGKGFYVYQGRRKKVNSEIGFPGSSGPVSTEDACKRMIYIMINEAARCLSENIIDSAATVDIGMVMGTGFPPFRTGLLKYADSLGAKKVVEELRRFAGSVSAERFEPSPLLVEMAEAGQAFYGKAD